MGVTKSNVCQIPDVKKPQQLAAKQESGSGRRGRAAVASPRPPPSVWSVGVGGGGTKSGSADEWLNEAALQDWSALPHASVNTGWAHRAGVRVPYSRPRKPDSPGESVVTITAQCIPLRVAHKSVQASSF